MCLSNVALFTSHVILSPKEEIKRHDVFSHTRAEIGEFFWAYFVNLAARVSVTPPQIVAHVHMVMRIISVRGVFNHIPTGILAIPHYTWVHGYHIKACVLVWSILQVLETQQTVVLQVVFSSVF